MEVILQQFGLSRFSLKGKDQQLYILDLATKFQISAYFASFVNH